LDLSPSSTPSGSFASRGSFTRTTPDVGAGGGFFLVLLGSFWLGYLGRGVPRDSNLLRNVVSWPDDLNTSSGSVRLSGSAILARLGVLYGVALSEPRNNIWP